MPAKHVIRVTPVLDRIPPKDMIYVTPLLESIPAKHVICVTPVLKDITGQTPDLRHPNLGARTSQTHEMRQPAFGKHTGQTRDLRHPAFGTHTGQTRHSRHPHPSPINSPPCGDPESTHILRRNITVRAIHHSDMCIAIRYAPPTMKLQYACMKYGLGNFHSAGATVTNKFGNAHTQSSPRRFLQCDARRGYFSASKHRPSITRTTSANASWTISQYPHDACESRAMTSPVTPIRCALHCAVKNFAARYFS